MTLLYADRFITATLVDHPGGLRRIVRVVRSSEPYGSIAELELSYAPLYVKYEMLPRSSLALLLDLRAVVARNDPEFETAVARHRTRMTAGFYKVGILVRSAVGKLQVTRHIREDGIVALVSDDERELLDAIAKDVRPSRVPRGPAGTRKP
jgi:hypothetical protein